MRGDLSMWITVFLVLVFSPFVHPVSCQDKEVVAAWDCAAGTHVLWHVKTEGYNGSPVAHQDKILLGANSALPHNPQIKDRHGVFTCFSGKTGKLLWQATHSRLPDRHNDMPGAMFARASVEGNRAYYISNRGELVCLDLNGSQIWKLDMVGELGVFKRDAGDVCSPLPGTLLVGDLVYAVTGNGVDGLTEVPKPKAPSFVAVNKNTGRVVWSSNLPGKDIIFSSWGAPVFAQVTGQDQVIFPGGDGWLYGFEPRSGRLLWKFDCNPAHATRGSPTSWGTADFFVAAPTVDGHMLYAALAKIPEMGPDPRRPLLAIDLRRMKDSPQKAIVWQFRDAHFGGLFGSVVLKDGLLYASSADGVFFALDAKTGRELWRSYLDRQGYAGGLYSPCIHEGKVFVGSEESVYVFQTGRSKKCLGCYNLPAPVHGAPAAADKVLYVSTDNELWALQIVD